MKKVRYLIITCCSLIFAWGCIRTAKSGGPVGTFQYGQWKLDGYFVKGQSQPLSEASDKMYLTHDQTPSLDSIWLSFANIDKKVTAYILCVTDGWDVSKKQDIGYYWLATKDGKKMRAIIHVDLPTVKRTKLELGGLIPVDGFSQADTIRYVYLPNE